MIDLTTPLQGMQSAEARLNTTASRIAQAGSTPSQPQSGKDNKDTTDTKDTVDLSAETVALMKEREDFEANLKTLQTENQMLVDTLQKMG